MSLIRKNDTVQVISGPERRYRTRGKVLEVYPKKSKVLVEGVNMRVKHERVRQNPDGSQAGGIVEREALLDISNVMFVHKDAPVRLGVQVKEDGSKVRVVRGGAHNGEEVD